MEPLYSVKPELGSKKLLIQQVIHYKARDGLDIPSYFTLPEGVTPKALPLVAFVHGPHYASLSATT